MPIKPITPEEVVTKKLESIPDEVIEAFNELIAKHWNGRSANFTQEAAMEAVLNKMNLRPKDRSQVYENHWLDVEDIYRKFGWKVEYDKPGYNESYSANFTFSKVST